MAETTITVPSFKFTGFYYPQILRTLRQFRRVNVPEITSENEHEPFEQLLRAYSLASHISNVLADLVALESLLPTSKLLSSVRDHLALIDFKLKQATPAQVDAILELTKVFTTSAILVEYRSEFATERTEASDEIVFEYLADVDGFTISRTDQLTKLVTEERVSQNDPSTAVLADKTTEANSVSASTFTPWSTPQINDAIYIGHDTAMWDRIDFVLGSGGGSSGIQGVWEFYDGDTKDDTPDDVTNNGSNLTFKLNGFLGTLDRAGAKIRVTYLPTGAFEDVYSTFSSPDNVITTVGLLAQTTTPSTDPDDYSVGSDWNPLSGVVDETNNLQQTGKVEFTLPQTLAQNWAVGFVEPEAEAAAPVYGKNFWIRYRITSITAPSSPVIEQVKITEGKQYVKILVTQGETVTDNPLGSSNGLPDQTFNLKREPLIDDTLAVTVDGDTFVVVDDFLSSGPQDKHVTVEIGDDEIATIKFGDGTNGAIPTFGVNNVQATYRVGGENDGNIAAGALSVNKEGLAFVASVINPREGNGWKIKDGGDDTDLARIKVAGPASLRTLGRAVSVGDTEAIATEYTSADGSEPVARAFSIEESFGPKTVEVIVVGTGGNFLASDQIDEFEEFLNGDDTAVPPTRGVLHANTEATVVNYERKTINVTATVQGGNQTTIENAVAALLSPLRLLDDGVTFQHNFGGEVPLSVIIDAIHNTSTLVRKVTLTAPSEDVVLGIRQLPFPGTITITVTS